MSFMNVINPDDGDKLIRELPFSSLILPASGL